MKYDPLWINDAFPPELASFTANFISLIPNLDVVCFNCYGNYFSFGNPGTSGLTPQVWLERGLSWTSNGTQFSVVLNQFGAIRYSMAKASIASKPFWCTETGWASKP